MPDRPCPLCRDVGWVLDSNPDREPLTVELIACPVPGCEAHGRRIEHLSLNHAGFSRVVHGDGRLVMAVGR